MTAAAQTRLEAAAAFSPRQTQNGALCSSCKAEDEMKSRWHVVLLVDQRWRVHIPVVSLARL
jgi:hypothetical protein